MVKKYCRKSLCFYICAILTCASTEILANGNGGNSSGSYFTDEGKRIIDRENFIVLNHEMDIPEFYPIDNEMNNLLSRWNIKGAAVGIAKDGKIVYAKGYGYADHQNKVKVQPDHLFRLASVSKLITATAIFRLIEQGKVSLDSPVFGKNGILNDSIFNKQIKDKRVEDITIRHLLNHTAGWTQTRNIDVVWLPDYKLDNFLPGPFNLKTKLIAYTINRGLGIQPGSKSTYSNVGYVILGDVIERVAGTNYYDFVRENIFQPCKISDIFPGRSFMEERYADETLYYDMFGARMRTSVFGEEGILVPGPYGSANIELLGPGGGWVGSVRELLKLCLAIDGFDDAPDILSKESIEEMTMKSPGILPIGWAGVSEDRWWRTGTLSGTSALMVRKNDGISYVVLINTSTSMRSQFTSELYKVMERGLAQVNSWPDPKDIFVDYSYKNKIELQGIPSIEKKNLMKDFLFLPDMVRE
jgi:CubicO group peptidase (beta-lactamase class C family)